MKRCLINVEGGLGKNVMFTSILGEFKEKKGYDEIYIVSPYNDVFKCCPAVTDAFAPMPGTLYQELVLDDDCDIYWKDPYNNQRFIKKQCHLFDAWAEELGFTLDDDPMSYEPDINTIANVFPALKEVADRHIQEWHNNFCIVQFNGGQSPLAPMQDQSGHQIPYDMQQEPIKRNYFKGAEIVRLLKEKYGQGCTIVHFALPNEPTIPGTVKVQMPYLTYRLLAHEAKAIVCTDSSLQHLSTGLSDNITVIWGETRPEHFGYKRNNNVCAQHVFNSQPYFRPLGASPSIVRMPEPEVVMEKIMQEDNK